MEIGLYFGSFNPVHIGHLIIANHVKEHTALNEIWFVVTPRNPLKEASSLLNEYHRLHLVRIALEDNPKIKTCDIEFSLKKPSFTIDTLECLSKKHPNHRFTVIIGGDSFQNIHKWKRYPDILNHFQVVVFERPGFMVEPIHHMGNSRIQVLTNTPHLSVSSTYVRTLIQNGKDFRYLVPDPVYKEIVSNNYYR